VIVADSYEAVRRPCSRYLEHFAFDVAALAEGDEVARELDRRPPALILMGTNLSNPSTEELLDRAAKKEGIPVILFADSAEQAPPSALTSAWAVLVKPFALMTMMDAVRNALRSHRSASTA
jgi:DNA-binding response OmpR family regulator